MVCKYLFEMTESEISYWNMRTKGVKSAQEIKVLSFTGCIANNKDMCPKKKIKGKVTPHCWRFVN